jgi:hypothetical protein
MKKASWLSIVSFALSFLSYSQKVQIIVPRQQIVLGTAFQIQYVVSDPSEIIKVITPSFDSFQLVSGPNYYKGNRSILGKEESIENITYTLVPFQKGIIKIPAIEIQYKNGFDIKSDNAFITVISPPLVSYNTRSSYTDIQLYQYRSDKDVKDMIHKNLFIKVQVNKRTVYTGEPVIVTFTLFSRLQSSSEAVKSPGLYGFSMIDMININKSYQAIKNSNGKIFNTSLLRKMQLYPVQPGKLEIDPMYVHNEIEFADSSNKDKKNSIETTIKTESLPIVVKELPGKRPENFTGAVGSFAINAIISPSEISSNQQGKLIVRVKGKGNFIQFGQPVIGFIKQFALSDPVIKDSINNQVAPEEGERQYEFSFSVDSEGSFKMPPIVFSYFDLSSKTYKTVYTDSIPFKILRSTENKRPVSLTAPDSNTRIGWISILTGVVLACALFIFLSKKNKPRSTPQSTQQNPYLLALNQIDVQKQSIKEGCIEIQKVLWAVSRESNQKFSEKHLTEIKDLIKLCQLAIYSPSDIIDLNHLKKKAIDIVSELFR